MRAVAPLGKVPVLPIPGRVGEARSQVRRAGGRHALAHRGGEREDTCGDSASESAEARCRGVLASLLLTALASGAGAVRFSARLV
jgi:hypothetical protein